MKGFLVSGRFRGGLVTLLACAAFASSCKRSFNESQTLQGPSGQATCRTEQECMQEYADLSEFSRFAAESEARICGFFGGSFNDLFRGNWFSLQQLIGMASKPSSVSREVGGGSANVMGATASLAMKTPCQIAQLYSAVVSRNAAVANAEAARYQALQVASEMCARMRQVPGFQVPADCARYR